MPIFFGSPYETPADRARWSTLARRREQRQTSSRFLKIIEQLQREVRSPQVEALQRRREEEREGESKFNLTRFLRKEEEEPYLFARDDERPGLSFNPFKLFSPSDHALVQDRFSKLTPERAAVVSLALDPSDKVPLLALKGKTRDNLSKARVGDFQSLDRLLGDETAVRSLHEVGKNLLLARQRLERLVPVRNLPVRETPEDLRRLDEALLVGTIEGRPLRLREALLRPELQREVDEEKASLTTRLRELFPTAFSVDLDEETGHATVKDAEGNEISKAPPSPRLVRLLHGGEAADNYVLVGPKSLPRTSPLRRGDLGDRALRFLSNYAEQERRLAEEITRARQLKAATSRQTAAMLTGRYTEALKEEDPHAVSEAAVLASLDMTESALNLRLMDLSRDEVIEYVLSRIRQRPNEPVPIFGKPALETLEVAVSELQETGRPFSLEESQRLIFLKHVAGNPEIEVDLSNLKQLTPDEALSYYRTTIAPQLTIEELGRDPTDREVLEALVERYPSGLSLEQATEFLREELGREPTEDEALTRQIDQVRMIRETFDTMITQLANLGKLPPTFSSQVFSTLGELALLPMEQTRRHVIEPTLGKVLPEFEYELKFAHPFFYNTRLLETQMDAIGAATDQDSHVYEFTFDKEAALELSTWVADPLNLLPVVGWGPELVKLGRLAGKGSLAAARRLGVELVNSPRTYNALRGAARLWASELSVLITGGKAAVTNRRLQVLRQIAEGVSSSTADQPLRRSLEAEVRRIAWERGGRVEWEDAALDLVKRAAKVSTVAEPGKDELLTAFLTWDGGGTLFLPGIEREVRVVDLIKKAASLKLFDPTIDLGRLAAWGDNADQLLLEASKNAKEVGRVYRGIRVSRAQFDEWVRQNPEGSVYEAVLDSFSRDLETAESFSGRAFLGPEAFPEDSVRILFVVDEGSGLDLTSLAARLDVPEASSIVEAEVLLLDRFVISRITRPTEDTATVYLTRVGREAPGELRAVPRTGAQQNMFTLLEGGMSREDLEARLRAFRGLVFREVPSAFDSDIERIIISDGIEAVPPSGAHFTKREFVSDEVLSRTRNPTARLAIGTMMTTLLDTSRLNEEALANLIGNFSRRVIELDDLRVGGASFDDLFDGAIRQILTDFPEIQARWVKGVDKVLKELDQLGKTIPVEEVLTFTNVYRGAASHQREALRSRGVPQRLGVVTSEELGRDYAIREALETGGDPLVVELRAAVDQLDNVPGRIDPYKTLRSTAVPTRFGRVVAPKESFDEAAELLLERTQRELDDLLAGEAGGGLRRFKVGDVVRVKEGIHKGKLAVVRGARKVGRVVLDLETGKQTILHNRGVDALDVNEVVTLLERPRTPVEREALMGELREELALATGRRKVELQKQLDGLLEQDAKQAATAARIMAETSAEAGERAQLLGELSELRAQLSKARAKDVRKSLERRIDELTAKVQEIEPQITSQAAEEAAQAYTASKSHEIADLQKEASKTSARLNEGGLADDEVIELNEKLRQVYRRMVELRAESDEVAETIVRTSQPVQPGVITPETLSFDEYLTIAFARPNPVARAIRATLGKFAPTRLPVRLYDPSVLDKGSPLGRAVMALEKLQTELQASSALGAQAVASKRFPFERTARGIEPTTGKPLWDVVNNWDQYRHLFGAEHDDFVQLLHQLREEAFRDARKLRALKGSETELWHEATYAFASLYREGDVVLRRLDREANRPMSLLRHNSYKVMADGDAQLVDWTEDFLEAWMAGVHNLREVSAKQAFFDYVKFTRGVPLMEFVARDLRREVAVAARKHAWSLASAKYSRDSLRGRPPSPILRAAKSLGEEPPQELRRLTSAVLGINLNTRLRGDEKRKALAPLIKKIEVLRKGSFEGLKQARRSYRESVERIDRTVQPGKWFGVEERIVDVGQTSIRDFPELQGRLYLREDLDHLQRVWSDKDNEMAKLAQRITTVTGVIKTGRTAFDPGFWFIQGLGALGLDTWRTLEALGTLRPDEAVRRFPLTGAMLAPFGKSQSVWGSAMWRSIVGLANPRAAADYWRREALAHPEEMTRFIRFGRILSSPGNFSEEILQELTRGGFIEQFERRVPLLNKIRPAARVGNAFSNFMNASSWETWKALEPLTNYIHELEELGSFVRNISGRGSVRQLGISRGQEVVERNLFFASAFTRAGFAVMGKAMLDPLSFGGRQAAKSLAGLGMAMTFTFGSVTLAEQLVANGGDLNKIDWEDLTTDLRKAWTPWDKQFFAVRLGNTFIGFGGSFRSNVSILARLGKAGYYDVQRIRGDETPFGAPTINPIDREHPFLVNFNHPVIRGFRGKLGPVPGITTDLLSGRDFIGYEVSSPRDFLLDPKGLPRHLAVEFGPFGLSAALEVAGLSAKERVGTGFSEWFGLRTFPVSAGDLYKEEASKALGKPWEEVADTELLRQAREDKDAYPELFERWKLYKEDQRRRDNQFRKISDIVLDRKLERDKRLLPLALEINWNTPGGAEFYTGQSKEIMANYRLDYDLAASVEGIDLDDLGEREFLNRDAELEAQLVSLDPLDFRKIDPEAEFEIPRINWDKYFQAREAVIAQMTPENQAAVREKRYLQFTHPKLAEVLRRKDTATEALQSYFDAPKYKNMTLEESEQVDDLLEQASRLRDILRLRGRKVDRRDILLEFLRRGIGDFRVNLYAALATSDVTKRLILSDKRERLVMDNPDLAVFFSFTFRVLDEDQKEEWFTRHGFGRGFTAGGPPLDEYEEMSREEAEELEELRSR